MPAAPRAAVRGPNRLEQVTFASLDVAEFRRTLLPMIRKAGIFIRSAWLEPVGATFKVEISLRDQPRAVVGTVQVVAHRETGGRSGMAVRFIGFEVGSLR
jgi:hypothetical protein